MRPVAISGDRWCAETGAVSANGALNVLSTKNVDQIAIKIDQ